MARGNAVVTTLIHRQDTSLSPWRSRVISREHYQDVYDDQFQNESHHAYRDDAGGTLIVEISVDFTEYAPEEG